MECSQRLFVLGCLAFSSDKNLIIASSYSDLYLTLRSKYLDIANGVTKGKCYYRGFKNTNIFTI